MRVADVEGVGERAGQEDPIDLVGCHAESAHEDRLPDGVRGLGLGQVAHVGAARGRCRGRARRRWRVLPPAKLVSGSSRPARLASASTSTSPEPQIPSGGSVADRAPGEGRPVPANRLDRAVRAGHAVADPAALEGGPGRARGRDHAPPVADDHLGVGADVDQQRDPGLGGEAGRDEVCGDVGADVAGDERRRRTTRPCGWIRRPSSWARRSRLVDGGPPLRDRHLGNRAERRAAERRHVEAEEEVAHRGVADDHGLEDLVAVDAAAAGTSPRARG